MRIPHKNLPTALNCAEQKWGRAGNKREEGWVVSDFRTYSEQLKILRGRREMLISGDSNFKVFSKFNIEKCVYVVTV